MKLKNPFLLLSCFKFTGIGLVFIFILSLTVYKLIFLTLSSFGLLLVILKFSLKNASTSSVEHVLGSLWGYYGGEDDDKTKGLRIIAHRACGLDAPENSITALKNVSLFECI